jgi:TrmH family RNA methyltransferase
MPEIFPITSLQNDRFKSLQALREKKSRDDKELFIVEGQKEISLAAKNGFIIESLWVIDSQIPRLKTWIDGLKVSMLYSLTDALFNKIGYREKTEGVVAVVHFKITGLSKLKLNESSLVIVADQLEKPGNVGTLFRIADGVGADAVILAGVSTDVYNPNVIRNSVGTFFTTPFVVAEPDDVAGWLAAKELIVVVASPDATSTYHELVWPKRTALVVGREHEGVQSNWGKKALQVKIPMAGQNDSLNVAVSTGILAYEWRRNHPVELNNRAEPIYFEN